MLHLSRDWQKSGYTKNCPFLSPNKQRSDLSLTMLFQSRGYLLHADLTEHTAGNELEFFAFVKFIFNTIEAQ